MTASIFGQCWHTNAGGTPQLELEEGQVWSIKSPTLTTAKVVVGRVEAWNGKVAVHVRLIDVPVPSGTAAGNELISINHVPFDRSALVPSVDQLLATGVRPTPEFEHGYEVWRKDRNAGIFEISVSEAIALMLEKIKRGRT